MKLSFSIATLGAGACLVSTANGFATPVARTQSVVSPVFMTTMAESGVPPTTSDFSEVEEVDIPSNLPSDCGMDYVPLATMLATGQLAEADQVSHVNYVELKLYLDDIVWDRLYPSIYLLLEIQFRFTHICTCISLFSLLAMPSLPFPAPRRRDVTLSTLPTSSAFPTRTWPPLNDCGRNSPKESLDTVYKR
jgi:hypothetical protein